MRAQHSAGHRRALAKVTGGGVAQASCRQERSGLSAGLGTPAWSPDGPDILNCAGQKQRNLIFMSKPESSSKR